MSDYDLLVLAHAEPIPADSDVNPLRIWIADPVRAKFEPAPGSDDWVSEWRQFYQKEAAALADALSSHLPGGTMHALLIELLKRKHSLLVIADKASTCVDGYEGDDG